MWYIKESDLRTDFKNENEEMFDRYGGFTFLLKSRIFKII